MEQMQDLPAEEQKKGMEMWTQCLKKYGDGLVDSGKPISGGQKLNVDCIFRNMLTPQSGDIDRL